MNSEKLGEICNGVWRDRAGLLAGRGVLSGEAALLRAVYWRLCKAGVKPNVESYRPGHTAFTHQFVVDCLMEPNSDPHFDGAPLLTELVQRYHDEARHSL
jgi:hypothetical protein